VVTELARRRQLLRRSRRSERGAVIFIVIMVLTVLSAIGIFAARAAGLNQRMSGYARQATQTAYVAEYGTLAMIDELSGDRKAIYLAEMAKGTELCRADERISGVATMGLPCYRVYMSELQDRLQEDKSGITMFDDTAAGSFGSTELRGDFVVELTDRSRAGRAIAGMDQGGVGPRFRYDQVTLTTTGQVRPNPGAAVPNTAVCSTTDEQMAAQVAGTRSMRAIVQVGPIPE